MTEAAFVAGCQKRGLCPRCLNAGESNDHDIDLFGKCRNCGWEKSDESN